MKSRIKLSKENAERLAQGKPMKMLRGRLGWHKPGTMPPPLQDLHPALHRSEEVEGVILVEEARRINLENFLIHIPNQGGSGAAGRARSRIMKSQGQRAGVSDYILAYPYAGMGGMWLELKASTGKPTDDQEKFLERMQNVGYAACFAYTAEGALNAMRAYITGNWPR